MKLVGAEQTERKPRRETKPKHVIYLNTKLGCQRCDREWTVANLNPERKVVGCPVCGEPNDIKEAVKRAA
jgi:transcription elongation factor Elf1